MAATSEWQTWICEQLQHKSSLAADRAGQIAKKLVDDGWETNESLAALSSPALEALGFTKGGERARILQALAPQPGWLF
jgi:hypothetical protein